MNLAGRVCLGSRSYIGEHHDLAEAGRMPCEYSLKARSRAVGST
jgi:hypothetical protein